MKNGLDDRHRDADGRISKKHGNTTVESLREIYGEFFAEDWRSDAHLETVLKEEGCESLTQYLQQRSK